MYGIRFSSPEKWTPKQAAWKLRSNVICQPDSQTFKDSPPRLAPVVNRDRKEPAKPPPRSIFTHDSWPTHRRHHSHLPKTGNTFVGKGDTEGFKTRKNHMHLRWGRPTKYREDSEEVFILNTETLHAFHHPPARASVHRRPAATLVVCRPDRKMLPSETQHPVLFSQGCCNESSHAGWVKTTETYPLSFGGQKSKIRKSARLAPPGRLRKSPSHASLLALGDDHDPCHEF